MKNKYNEMNGLGYSNIQDMTFLDMVVNETLRLHSPHSLICRQCTKEYKLQGTKVTLRPGQHVQISVLGIHRDPEFYPDPLAFNPENFTEENKSKRSPYYTFLAFGQGPRSCIGMQFALSVTKACLVKILSRFSFEACKETPEGLTRDPASLFGNPAEQVFVRVVERQL